MFLAVLSLPIRWHCGTLVGLWYSLLQPSYKRCCSPVEVTQHSI